MTKRRALSERATAVLRAIRDEPGGTPDDVARRTGIAGAGLYDSLVTLRGRFLIRWDAGGFNLRATRAGSDLLRQATYRDRGTR